MLHDPARVADTRVWLDRVATDLRVAALDLGATPPILEDVVFHCQQAVEKAMKAQSESAHRGDQSAPPFI